MKLSVYTLACPEFTFEQAAAKLVQHGIPGVEWRVGKVTKEITFDPRDPGRFWSSNRATIPQDDVENVAKRVAKITADHGLQASILAGAPQPTELDQIRREMAAAQTLGAFAVRVAAGPVAADIVAAFDSSREAWEAVEDLARRTGVKALVEIHHGTLIPTASATRRFVQDRDPKHVGVLYDPGNMVWEGTERPDYALQMIRPWLAHVHVKNARAFIEGADERRCLRFAYRWCSLRTGMVNWAAIVAALRKVGYDGFLSLEDFTPETQADAKLADFADLFKQILGSG
ncbi:MAG: sugar phosphate isomerase/epimerase [Planctomycetes bacterium]|nr:sugar phosphate isomerase/epimerase [Planctomycetota bacterium]